jgi:hypothetical protein
MAFLQRSSEAVRQSERQEALFEQAVDVSLDVK